MNALDQALKALQHFITGLPLVFSESPEVRPELMFGTKEVPQIDSPVAIILAPPIEVDMKASL